MQKKESIPVILLYREYLTKRRLTWLGGICFPLRRSSRSVPKLYITLSGVILPMKMLNTSIIKKMLMISNIIDEEKLINKIG